MHALHGGGGVHEEWCNADERKRSAEACNNAYVQSALGDIRFCRYDSQERACRLGDAFAYCPPLPPSPPGEPPSPPRPPVSPSPPDETTPYLTSKKCDAALRDPAHLFRRMWAADAWTPMGEGPDCWSTRRDSAHENQSASVFFDELFSGTHCESNWYEGNRGEWIGGVNSIHQPRPVPVQAVLGFDGSIDDLCWGTLWGNSKDRREEDGNTHASRCIRANFNILSLYSGRVPYNQCRNLEWEVCAAKGLLPDQRRPGADHANEQPGAIVFARAPNRLRVRGDGMRLGQCSGWVPQGRPLYGYATDDVFYLEVCILNQICENGAEIFDLNVGDPFRCQVSDARMRELQSLLLEPRQPYAGKACTEDQLVMRSCEQTCYHEHRRTACQKWLCKGCSMCR